LGHCMRKLVHLVFAIWKTARPFNGEHYPWADPPQRTTEKTPEKPNDIQTAAGHNGGMPVNQPVVTAAAVNVKPIAAVVNQKKSPGRRQINFAEIRKQVTMKQVLENLGCLQSLKGRRPQLRGPCPIHGT